MEQGSALFTAVRCDQVIYDIKTNISMLNSLTSIKITTYENDDTHFQICVQQ